MGEYFKKSSESCVSVNIFAECGSKKDNYSEHGKNSGFDKENSCIEINVYPKCEQDFFKKEKDFGKEDEYRGEKDNKKEDAFEKKDKDSSCVVANIYADCNKKERPYCKQ